MLMTKCGELMRRMLILLIVLLLSGCSMETKIEDHETNMDQEVTAKDDTNAPFIIAAMDFPPHEHIENGEFVGPGIEVVKEAMKRMGYEASDYEFVEYPWSRIIETIMSDSQDFDMVLDIFDTDERREHLDYSTEPLMYYPQVLVVRKNEKVGPIEKLEDLKPYTIGTVKHYSYGSEIDQAIEKGIISTDEVIETEQNLKKVKNGRIKMTIESYYSAVEIIQKNGYDDDLEIIELPVEVLKSYVAFPKNKHSSEFVKRYDETIAEMRNDGTEQAIYEAYYGSDYIGVEKE